MQLGVDGHRRGALQVDLGRIVTIGHVHTVNAQLVVAAFVLVQAREIAHLHWRLACPFDLVDLERQLDVYRQGQALQWLARLLCHRVDDFFGRQHHLAGVQPADLELLVGELRQIPIEVEVLHIDIERRRLEFERIDMAAGLQ